MDMKAKNMFIHNWNKFFNNAELPISFYYTDKVWQADLVKPGTGPRCIMSSLAKVRSGQSLAFDADGVACEGGKTYLGFSSDIGKDMEYFLSYGIPGKVEGERLKKTPEIVKQFLQKNDPPLKAPGKYIVFKRWDMLEAEDSPAVVIFYATADIISGLMMLASFDEAEQNTVIAPWGSGCSYIVYHPYMETMAPRPRAVMGGFDISIRSFIPKDRLTFSVPMNKFASMVNDMEESFLISKPWKHIQKRITQDNPKIS
ncbi:MAG TPA: DUF169 domain-containing protein [Dehalococcoidales bacterium]|nr:DUF169 domain-containing protein [Dehalococcoidales bacterium]